LSAGVATTQKREEREDLMKAQAIMTSNPVCCLPDDMVQQAASLMAECDCGVIPVVEDKQSMRLVGVVTDRDLAVRGLAQGKGADAKVRDLMTTNPSCCHAGDDVKVVEQVMSERQVRRVPVVDDSGCCLGVIAQADLARAAEQKGGVSDREVARVVERISEPTPGPSSGAAGGRQEEVRL
jgi:CBS domain-containing protein